MKFTQCLFILTFIGQICGTSVIGQSLETDFMNPPSSAKPHVWWHWMNGNISSQGITADLEAMSKAGIGGATVLDIGMYDGQGIKTPVGEVKTLSQQWLSLMKHAATEANRLGLEIGFHNCGGWQSSGGPWITEDMAMKKVVWSKTLLEGPMEHAQNLAMPALQSSVSKSDKKESDNSKPYYRDYKVIAYPYEKKICSFATAEPDMYLNGEKVGAAALDGNPESWISFHEKGKNDTTTLLFSFKKAFTSTEISILPKASSQWPRVKDVMNCRLLTSNDGRNYELNTEFTVSDWQNFTNQSIEKATAKFYKLEMDIPDYLRPFDLAEITLLKSDEKPLFYDDIPFLNVKLGGALPNKISNYTTFELDQENAGNVDPNKVHDITQYVTADGRLNWKVPEGNWAIVRIGYTITGAKNHPSTPESHGLECDKMNSKALDVHFANMPKLIAETAGDLVGKSLTYTLIDSWECRHQNWTEKFPEEFAARRGYEIWPYLPILTGDIVSSALNTEKFLYDYRLTISDLISENYYRHFQELSKNVGLKTHAESIYPDCPACPPVDVMLSSKHSDVPMVEFWANDFSSEKDFIEMKNSPQALPKPHIFASTMHLYDKKILASEAFTTMYAHWKETPENMKGLADYHLSSGVNRMVYHSFAHQPEDEKPGYTLGMHGVCYNRHNTLFEKTLGFNQYLSRVQWLAQSGRYAADILYFLGDDLPTITSGLNTEMPGYSYDYCNADALTTQFKVVDGKLTLANGAQYSVLVLPERKGMKTSTLELLQSLAKQGVFIVGPKPDFNISLEGGFEKDKKFKAIINNLWGDTAQKNRIQNSENLPEILQNANILPDFKVKSVPATDILYTHHTLDSLEAYFVVNQYDHKVINECAFRQQSGTPELWNPETGKTVPLRYYYHKEGYTHVLLPLQPNQSVFVVFNNRSSANYYPSLTYNGRSLLPLDTTIAKGSLPDFTDSYIGHLPPGNFIRTNQDGTENKITREPVKIVSVSKPWKVELTTPFDENYRLDLKDLRSLSKNSNKDIKHFSGTAMYRNSVLVDTIVPKAAYILKLGRVAEIADVYMNGSKVSSLWKTPYQTDIAPYLKAGLNNLEIVVTNSWTNRVIGDLNLPVAERKTWTTADIDKWFTSDTPLIKAGLLGPVEISIVEQ